MTYQASHEILAVIDTQIMVPAIALKDPEHGFYVSAIRKCWKFVFSEEIIQEYQRVIKEYGMRGDVVHHELIKLYHMNKYRTSRADTMPIGEELSPRKDKHIIGACQDVANTIVSNDRGILQRSHVIQERLMARVISLQSAIQELATRPDC